MADATHLASALTARRWPPRPTASETTGLAEVAESGRFTEGLWTLRAETSLAELVGARFAVAFNSCTSAIHAALIAHGTRPWAPKTVGAAAFGFLGTLTGAGHLGCDLALADPDPATLNLPDYPGPHADLVIAVDLHGVPHDLDRADPRVITDACQSLGTWHGAQPVGSVGTHCWSFSSAKMVSAPDGGAITTNDGALAATLREIRNYGLRADSARAAGMAVRLGHNWRASELSMVLVAHRLREVSRWSARSRAVTAQIHEAGGTVGLWHQKALRGSQPAWHKIRVGFPDDPQRADRLERALNDAGVPTHRWGSVPLHKQWILRPPLVERPIADAIAAGTFCLGTETNPPMTWTDDEVAQVCDLLITLTEASS